VLPSRCAEDLYAGWWRLIAELEGRGCWCGMDGATFGCWLALTWIGWQHMLRLPRDHYLRMDGNDCAVHPAAPTGSKPRPRPRPQRPSRHQLTAELVEIQLPKLIRFSCRHFPIAIQSWLEKCQKGRRTIELNAASYQERTELINS
jgi:hypothetical protein